MASRTPRNQDIALLLNSIANLLEIQNANPFKVRAYRLGAKTVLMQDEPVAKMVFSGDGRALKAMPGIGESLAAVVEEYVKTGKSQLLNRLKGAISAEEVMEQVPGIGKGLAERIVRDLHVRNLEDLELAAHDGRLAQIEGFGKRRVASVRASLAGILSGFALRRVHRWSLQEKEDSPDQPSVAQLLEVDMEYRKKAANNELKKIAPKRFNPGKVAWLPVLHTEKEDWSFTALYSNTAKAHELDKTHDWVIVFFEKNGLEGQATIVTETNGSLAGKRVVRGRENECMKLPDDAAIAAIYH